MEESKKIEVTPEEAKAEQEALAESKEEEIREGIISEYGFDKDNDSERIEKMVKKEVAQRKTLSTAIGQKVGYRDKYNKYIETPPETPPQKPPKETDEEKEGKAFDQRYAASRDKDFLEGLNYPDELKDKIKRVAEINKISVKKALDDSYIKALVEQHKKDQGVEEASTSRTHVTDGGSHPSGDKLPELDMNTKEGREDWEKWKKEQVAKGN